MTVTLVAAVGANGVIGAAGGLPWHLPEDLAHFKRVTLGHPMIMGRTTFESIGRVLPGRTTIVITRQSEWSAPGVETAGSLDDALALAGTLDDEVFVVGGGQVYREALERGLVDIMSITRIADSPAGDTWFPTLDWSAWQEIGRVAHVGPEPDRVSFDIVTYQRG